MDLWVIGKQPHLGLNCAENPGHFCSITIQIGSRENPQRDRGDTEVRAPVEHFVEFARTHVVDLACIKKPPLSSVPTVPIEDDADVARDRVRLDLVQEPAFIEAIEYAA